MRASVVSQQSRILADSLAAMETALTDYTQQRDEALYRAFVVRHSDLRQAVESLAGLQLGEAFESELRDFLTKEQAFVDDRRGLTQDQLSNRWRALEVGSRWIIDQGRELAEAEGLAAAAEALKFERVLVIQTLAVVPLSVVLAIVFARLISRPIRQIDLAIRALAADSSHGSIEIQGPRDLQEVGSCLDALRSRIAALEKEKSSFVRRISHELKTPLTTIRQGAELLADPGGTPPDQAAEIGQLLKESSLELQHLIEDLLEFGKTQRLAREDFSVNSVSLAALVQRLVNEHALALKSKRVKLTLDLEEVSVPGDAKRLRTALNNIIANAVKYTPADGQVSIRLMTGGRMAVLDVVDTGPGISADDRARVFEPFYQGQAATGSHVKGTGLGLAIAKDYIESHGGQIEILPSAQGAFFRVRLPTL